MRILLLLLFLVGCVTTAPIQRMNPEVYYKNDICFTYLRDTQKHGEAKGWFRNKILKAFHKKDRKQEMTFCGSGILPYDDNYTIKIEHTAKLNFVAMNTCHREITTENPDNGFSRKNGELVIDYNPTLELGKACPLYVAAYNRAGEHGWGIIVFENPRYELTATVECNGDTIQYNGVSICDSRQKLMQKITFDEEVVPAKPVNGAAERSSDCPILPTKDNKSFEFLMPNRECVYGFIGKTSRKWHQFYTVGYEQLVIRE